MGPSKRDQARAVARFYEAKRAGDAVARLGGPAAALRFLADAYPDLYEALREDPRVRAFGLVTAKGEVLLPADAVAVGANEEPS
jgi:hypothetical protein